MAAPPARKPLGNFTVRTLSALVLAPPVLAAVYFGRPWFDFLVAGAAGLMLWEWERLVRTAGNRLTWLVGGLLYVLAPSVALLLLRDDPETGRALVFWLLAVVWATDIGAYLFGRLIGGPKLAPSISPKKTWAGLLGGMFCAGLAGVGTALAMEMQALVQPAVVSALVGGLSQGGDLFESWVKRRFGAKDSGNLIPGHGGLLDRVDGLLAAAAATALIQISTGTRVLAWP